MTHHVQHIESATEITAAIRTLHGVLSGPVPTPREVITTFESWANQLDSSKVASIPGIPFLRTWLRRSSLEPIVIRELGDNALDGGWTESGRAHLKSFPLGIVGHWPAGNIDIQPILSMTCSLLGGNVAFVRVPGSLVETVNNLMETLSAADVGRALQERIFMGTFPHDRQDLQEAMAEAVDGAMIWGGKEAVLNIRRLPFPHWARIAVFGPRISVAAMDAAAWSDVGEQEAWCQRIARDVWQFDQQACSSPQVLFLERAADRSTEPFVSALKRAFEVENRAHPRDTIASTMTSAICQARATWLLKGHGHRAVFPQTPDWTLLLGSGSDIPEPTQGKTLTVLEVDDLFDPILKFDGNVQTLGLGMADRAKEGKLVNAAGQKGVDRIVKLGRMHVFVPPWDGVDLIRPMVRMVRHVKSVE